MSRRLQAFYAIKQTRFVARNLLAVLEVLLYWSGDSEWWRRVVERHFVLVGIRAVFFAAFLGYQLSTFRKKHGAFVFRSRDPLR
jgi:hypothetical protein